MILPNTKFSQKGLKGMNSYCFLLKFITGLLGD